MNTKKYALIGTSCVGKTTLVIALAKTLKKELPGIGVEIVEEAGRIYFTHNPTNEPFTYLHQRQVQTLQKLLEQIAYFKNPHIILTDRSVLDAVAYLKTMGANGHAKNLLIKEKEWLGSYNYFFLLDPKGVPYKTDNIRTEKKSTREAFHKTFTQILAKLKLPHQLISGTEQKRVKTMLKIILGDL